MALTGKQKRALLSGLIEKQLGRCCYCGRQFTSEGDARPTIEHKKARMDGGTDAIGNLAAACHHCNSLRGQQMNEARIKARRDRSAARPVPPTAPPEPRLSPRP